MKLEKSTLYSNRSVLEILEDLAKELGVDLVYETSADQREIFIKCNSKSQTNDRLRKFRL